MTEARVRPTIVDELASETLEWMAEDPYERDDVTDEVWRCALATFEDGVAITPCGYDVTEQFAGGERV